MEILVHMQLVKMKTKHSYLLSFFVCSVSFTSLKAETCPFRTSGNLTDGISAELIRTDGGILLGIRVSWSWLSSEPTVCFQSPKVELSNSTGRIHKTLNSISRNNSVEFLNLDCNVIYTPVVRATFGGQVQLFESGNALTFGSSSRSPPPALSTVCVGPSTAPDDVAQGRLNISWDPLPCHLQNGADISGYIIQYTQLSTGVATRVANSHTSFLCGQESSGPYTCRVAYTFFNHNGAYTFEVAARNSEGIGTFSDPITKFIPITLTTQDITTICVTHDQFVTGGTDSNLYNTEESTSMPPSFGTATVTSTEPESIPIIISQRTDSVMVTTAATYCSGCTCQQVWMLMGSLFAIMAVTAGIVIVMQFIINLALWKRLRSLNKDQTVILSQTSTLGERIDMKECLAYGQVISPQPVTEQPHIYETTT